MSDRDIDREIQRYRSEMARSTNVGRADLDEVEDHLRDLTAELRGRGMPAMDAVAEAARRLGEPTEVGREHARVRTAFGGALPTLRMVPAALFFSAALFIKFAHDLPVNVLAWKSGIEVSFGLVMVFALLSKTPWARPAMLGFALFQAIDIARLDIATPDLLPVTKVTGVLWFGAAAFLAPWNRRELAAEGVALTLQVYAFGMALVHLWFFIPESEQFTTAYYAPLGLLAIGACAASAFALVHRIRAGAIAALVAGVALIVEWGRQYSVGWVSDSYVTETLLVQVGAGVLSLLVAAISLRGVRGTMRGWGRAVGGS